MIIYDIKQPKKIRTKEIYKPKVSASVFIPIPKTYKSVFDKSFSFLLIFCLIFGNFLFEIKVVGAVGTTYYVDSSITDTNVGSATADCTNYDPTAFTCSGGSASAYKTIADINAFSALAAGDSVLFRKGQTWREQLTVPASGSSGSPITFGSYGSGSLPVIKGADLATSWTSEQNVLTWVLVNQKTGTTNTTAFDNPLTPGSLIIVGIERATAVGINTPTDTAGNTYIDSGAGVISFDSSTKQIKIFYALNTFSTASNVVTSNQSGARLSASEWTGNVASSPVDVYSSTANGNTGVGGGQNETSGAAVTTVNDDLVFGAQGYVSGTVTAGTGFTEIGAIIPLSTEYQIQSTMGSIAATWSNNTNSVNYGAIMAAFKVGSGSVTTIYYATAATEPKQVFRDGTRLTVAVSKLALVAGSWYWDAGNSRVYVADDPAGHTIEVSQRSYAVYGITKKYITVQDIEADMAQIYGVYFSNSNGVGNGNILIDRVTTQYNFTTGVRTDSIDNATFRSITAAHNGANGIGAYGAVVNPSDGLLIELSSTYSNSELDDTNYTGGMYLGGEGLTNVTIQDNVSYSNGYVGQSDSRGAGIWVDTPGAGLVVRRNNVYSNHHHGVFVECAPAPQIISNLSFNNGQSGINATCSTSAGINNYGIYNNTAYGNNIGIAIVGDGATAGSVMNNLIKNNIVSNSTSYSLDLQRGGENDGTYGSGNVYLYNSFGTAASNFIRWGTGVTKSTYADFDTAYGSATHSITGDPLFTNAAGNDFTLQSTSPAVDAGTNLGLTYQLGLAPGSSWPSSVTTLNQDTNGLGWDIGAYVYTETTAPTVSLTAPSDSATVSGSSVTLSATASDNSAIAGVQFKLDTNTNIGAEDITSTYGVTWDSTAIADGSHALIAVARDTYGNYATSSAVSVTVDNTAPVRSAGSPIGSQSAGMTQVTLSLTTDENTTCRYSTTAGTAYGSMTDFSTTGETSHSSTISGLSNGQSYNYYVRCQDGSSNANSDDYTISFSVASPASSGGGGWFASYPTAPTGGFTATASTTNAQNKTILHFGFGNDITTIAISDNINFNPASYMNATSSVEWTATTTKILYVKFCNQYSNQYSRCSNPISVQVNAYDLRPPVNPVLPTVPVGTTTVSSFQFNKTLEYGSNGNKVKELQNFLKQLGFFPQDIVSNGNFGPATKQAVIEYQKSVGINPNGVAGPRTRKSLHGEPFITNKEYQFTSDPKYGDTSEEVKQLQVRLKDSAFFPYWIKPTSWFGPVTQNAVNLFQKFYNLFQSGDINEETRNKLNQ